MISVTVPRWIFVAAALAVVPIAVSICTSVRTASTWKRDVSALRDSIGRREPIWRRDSKQLADVLDSLGLTRARLVDAGIYAAALEDEAERLRRQRRDVVVVSSVPGLPPSVGDTLRACRIELGLCAREAAIEKERADSLDKANASAVVHITAARISIDSLARSWAVDRGLLDRANGLLAAADAPCWLVRFGPIRAHCPDRTTVAAWAAGAATFAIGTAQRSRELQLVGGALVTIGFVW